jgi:hypothetical protein
VRFILLLLLLKSSKYEKDSTIMQRGRYKILSQISGVNYHKWRKGINPISAYSDSYMHYSITVGHFAYDQVNNAAELDARNKCRDRSRGLCSDVIKNASVLMLISS